MNLFAPPDLLLAHCLIRDRRWLRRQLKELEARQKKGQPLESLRNAIQQRIEVSQNRVMARRHALPTPHFEDDLPVNQKRQTIQDAIAQHPVVIICGETGSGKTTQLPKICLALGRGTCGLIGHTQPRRLAARSVANRIAQELGSPLGTHVGFKVRFTDVLSESNVIKLMTDGILLAETQTDRYLEAYDTIIIDEAHERSLNIDFLLGYLKQLLPKRPELKVIITSATIDAERFAQHFNQAPVIEVSGRTYPVDIHYHPLTQRDEDEREIEMEDAVVTAANQLARHGPGDILVFLPGEREIRETAESLRKTGPDGYEILPLFARQSHAEQQRIFKPSGGRRIILATNVAETSLTVPGIHYVIDTGLARIKRYSPRAKVEQLQIEKISQAAARQRAGRCGRTEAGVCIRLYSEQDFNARPAFTDPEIVRSNLAAVILRMAALRLGPIDAFPFIDPPSSRLIADGNLVLMELAAIDETGALTSIGKELARLPVDPRVGRILLAAHETGCLHDMLIIAAALSIQDPRIRPSDAREAADRAHARFADERSDFLSWLKLWYFFDEALRHKSSTRQLIQLCHHHYLSWLRLREWRELYGQLCTIMQQQKHPQRDVTSQASVSSKQQNQQEAALYESIHKALLTGLIGHIGMKSVDSDEYLSTRGGRFIIAPGSALKKNKPKWVVAAELVETSRLYARCAGRIAPEWVESLASHLIKRHYADPRWDKGRGDVVANERITLYSLTLIPRRTVSYSRIAPHIARELFIRGALVAMDYDSAAPFFKQNQQLIDEIETLEHKARRQDVLVDDEILFSFYDQRLPAEVVDAPSFETWRRQIEITDPRHLWMTRDELMRHAAHHITENQFPEWIAHPDGRLRLSYRFEPGHPLDGVTVNVPLVILNRLSPEPFEWLVPGMIREKLQLLIKSLPKEIRRLCVPVPDFITRFLCFSPDTSRSLCSQLSAFIQHEIRSTQPIAPIEDPLPNHLLFNFRIIDDSDQEIGMGRDLVTLQRQFGQTAQLTFRDSSAAFERDTITQWDFGDLPLSIQFSRGHQQLTGYPALKQENNHLALRLFDTPDTAYQAHRCGVMALLQQQLKEPLKQLSKGLPGFTPISLTLRSIMSAETLLADAITAICDRAFIGDDELPRTERAFNEQKARARTRIPAVTQAMTQILSKTAAEYQALLPKLTNHRLRHEIHAQLDTLVYRGFLSATPWTHLAHLPRYLQAIARRLDKYAMNPQRDEQYARSLRELWTMWHARIEQEKAQGRPLPEALLAFRWHIEELRVSLFAQELKTPYPVSVKRLQKIWSEL